MPADPRAIFGKRVRELRLERGFSQEKLAELADLHRNYVGGVERGERNVGLINIVKLGHRESRARQQEAEDRANRDRGRENRHFWLEIGLTIVIIALIGWEIDEGRQQAALLHQMNKNTADTALQIQRAASRPLAYVWVPTDDRPNSVSSLQSSRNV